MSIVTEAVAVIPALFSGSSWDMRSAFDTNGMWLFCFVATFIAGYLAHLMYRFVPFLERHLERGISVAAYLVIAGIICWGVIDRFVFSSQWSGSTTIPPFLFMVMAWFACAYNVKLRTHLSFSEFRSKMSPNGQMAALTMDAALWFIFCWIAVTTSLRFTALSADNFQLVDGVDNVMKWWFYITVPIAFALMTGRVFSNWLEDYSNYRGGNQIINTAVIGGDT